MRLKYSTGFQKGDGFVKYSGVKLPDTRNSWFNESMNLKECGGKKEDPLGEMGGYL